MTPPDVARVVICEDSPTYSLALRQLLEVDDDLRVVEVCQTAEELLNVLPQASADLVTMDLELPGMDGVQAIERIMGSRPVPIMVLSLHTGRGSERAAAALSAGALDAIPKSEVRLTEPDAPAAVALRRRVKRLARTRLRRGPRSASPRLRPRPASLADRPIEVVGICCSTGGPQALHAVLGALSADFPVPLLVVQHMTAGFTPGLIKWLERTIELPVREAVQGDVLRPGATFATEGAHLVVDRFRRLALDAATDDGWHRPSGNVLLRSLAEVFGARAAAMVLTGLGRDGADGLGAVAAAGGLTIAQDEESSAVFGMPRAAAQSGAELVLGLDEIAASLRTLAQAGAMP